MALRLKIILGIHALKRAPSDHDTQVAGATHITHALVAGPFNPDAELDADPNAMLSFINRRTLIIGRGVKHGR